jgi:hypothetical protein
MSEREVIWLVVGLLTGWTAACGVVIWVRERGGLMATLQKGFVRHPKITALSDGAFRLWVAGWDYCQQQLTDGLILKSSLAALGVRVTPKLLAELTQILPGYEHALWEDTGHAYAVHDWLDWNDSREVVQRDRASLRARVARARAHRCNAIGNAVTPNVTPTVTDFEITPLVREGITTNDQRPTTNDPTQSARVLSREELIPAFWETWRRLLRELAGQTPPLTPRASDFNWCLKLAIRYPDEAHLEQITREYLTTPDREIRKTARSLGMLHHWAGELETRLKDAPGGVVAGRSGHWSQSCTHDPPCTSFQVHEWARIREDVAAIAATRGATE